MDIDKLVALIKKNIYKNHKQQVTASLVQEAVVATALEIGVSHRELLEALKESDDGFSNELKRYYTKDEANELLDDKVDKENYKQDLDAVNERINASDAGVSENKQELNGIKKLLGEAADSSKVVCTAKGGGVITFPSNVLTNASPRYRIEGLTLQNLIKNGDFREGIKGWNGFDLALQSVEDNALTTSITKPGWATHISSVATEKNLVIGDKYYLTVEVHLDSESKDIHFQYGRTNTKNTKGLRGWNKYSVIVAITDTINTIRVYVDTSENFEEGDLIKFKNVMGYNLTSLFGKGNEPSQEWCDEHIQGYIDGTQSVKLPMRVKSYGANLWDKKYEVLGGGYWKSDGYNVSINQNASYNNKYIDAVGGDVFYTNKSDVWVDTVSYNSKKEVVDYQHNYKPTFIQLPNDNSIKYVRFSVYSIKDDIMFSRLKLNSNSQYIPYTESAGYITNNTELRSLPNTKDYVKDGKIYKNIARYYFTKEDKWALREDYGGDNFRYYMTLPFEYKATGAGVEGELLCNNFTPTSNVPSVLTEREGGTIALYRENASTIYLTLDKKVSDVNSVIPEGTFIDVILPQTEVTNLDTSGMVVARPNGTVFIEPVANLTAFYDNGLDVSKLVIEEVESFSTFKDGNYQELDVSKVSIKDGKLTHPDAVNGLCYLVYRHDNTPIYGNNEVDYYNSEKTLKSPNGTVWKKVEEATDDGKLVTKLEEVK